MGKRKILNGATSRYVECSLFSSLDAVWIITVDPWLKSKQHGSIAAQTAPGQMYGRLLSLASDSLQYAYVQIVQADGSQYCGDVAYLAPT